MQLSHSASQRRVFACGSMVLFDQTFIFFALVERKKDKRKKEVPLCQRLRAPTAQVLSMIGLCCYILGRASRESRRDSARGRGTNWRRRGARSTRAISRAGL